MIFKNATIVDGTLKKAYQGHIQVDGDKITKIYPASTKITASKATGEVVECAGKYVMPGFFDAHSHNDFFAGRKDNLEYFKPFVLQGVTTMVGGNCGFSAAGYDTETKFNDQIGGGLFSNQGKNYGDFGAWAKNIDSKMPVNLISMVGHGTVRIGLNGKASGDLSIEQLLEMDETIEKTLMDGAAGVSFGLMYEPGQFVPIEEIERVAQIVKKHGKIATFHARAYSKVSTSYNPPVGGRAHNLRAMDEVLGIAKKTQVKTQYSHLIFVGKQSWGTVDESLKMLETAKSEGLDIGFDLYPMEFGASVITVVLPTWYLAMDPKKRRTPLIRTRLWLEIQLAVSMLGFGFGDILISNTYGKMPELEGKRITEIAKEWKKSAFETYLEIVDKTNAKANVLMYKYQNKEIIEKLRTHPLSLYMTDAWVEEDSRIQNFACYHSFPKFLTLARDNKTSLEDAVYKMTGGTAKRFGVKNRGTIEVGNFADLVVVDLANLSFEEGTNQAPKGIDLVMNNGRVVVRKGVLDEQAVKTVGRFVSIL
jgi:N-acyl-D-amino-acid deacylase